MKVLHQLIRHFWQRGALTKEQADYLVEGGFIRATELERYEPRVALPGKKSPAHAEPRGPVIQALDPLEEKEERLSTPPSVKRKGSTRAARVADYSSANLGKDLRKLLDERVTYLPALTRLAATPLVDAAFDELAAAVRGLGPDIFRLRVLHELDSLPRLLLQWWECLDPEPFHLLLSQPKVRGPVARAFEAILTAASPGAWRHAAWLLKVPEVQTVANLMAVRRQLLPAIRWLSDKHRGTLGRSIRRTAQPPRSWQALGFGLVLVYNAQAWRAKRKPSGYVLCREPKAGWPEAWTTAISLDAELVVPFCVHILGALPEQGGPAWKDLSPRNFELVCPNQWKI